jgi:hypothetical protein
MSMVVKNPAVHILASWFITLNGLLPMIYNSNQQRTIMEGQGLKEQLGGGGGGLCLLGGS